MLQKSFSTVLLLCLQVDGLTFKQIQLSAANPLCKDEEYNTFMTPYILSIQTFFAAEQYSFYPFALSAIGALRYGANSVVVDQKRHLMDHDVDFLFSPKFKQIMNKTTVDSLFERLQVHLYKGGISNAPYYFTEVDIFMMAAIVLTWRDHGPDFHFIQSQDALGTNYSLKSLRLVAPQNDLTRKGQKEESTIGFQFLRRVIPASRKNDLQRSEDFVEMLRNNIAPREPSLWVQFDFFFSPDADQEQFQASNLKRMMFYGVSMDYPAREDVIVRGFQGSAWDPNSKYAQVAKKGNECHFHRPDDIFVSDAPAVSEEFELAKLCSRSLSEHGFQSLAHCF